MQAIVVSDSPEMGFHGQSTLETVLSTDLEEVSLTHAEVKEDTPSEQVASWPDKATSTRTGRSRPLLLDWLLLNSYIPPQGQCDAPIFGGHFFFFFFSYKSSMYFSYTYPKYMKLYCSNIFLQNAAQGHNPAFFLLTASRERRLLVYLKGGSHDGVSKAQ